MSIKHFNEYYNDLYKTYAEMVKGLEELQNTCNAQMVTPEMIDNYKKTLQPIKDSFLTLQYVKYLLNKPNKKSKQERYERLTKDVDKERFKQEAADNRERLEGLLK